MSAVLHRREFRRQLLDTNASPILLIILCFIIRQYSLIASAELYL